MHVRLLEGPYKGDIFEVGSVGVLLDPANAEQPLPVVQKQH